MDPLTDKQAIRNLRQDYQAARLELNDTDPDPLRQFDRWLQEAIAADLPEPNAMILATADPAGRPSARVVLLKGLGPEGLAFFTNFLSRKGRELDLNPHAALVFNWLELQRQVRIEGTVGRLPEAEATDYFQSRPKGSQIGAWASEQSSPVADRKLLEQRYAELEERYASQDRLPRPPHWGGYGVRPTRIEFWQGRPNRLHDRICYECQTDGSWTRQRLAP